MKFLPHVVTHSGTWHIDNLITYFSIFDYKFSIFDYKIMKNVNNWWEFDYKLSNYWLQNHGNDQNQPWPTSKIGFTKSNIEIWLLFKSHISFFIILITNLPFCWLRQKNLTIKWLFEAKMSQICLLYAEEIKKTWQYNCRVCTSSQKWKFWILITNLGCDASRRMPLILHPVLLGRHWHWYTNEGDV